MKFTDDKENLFQGGYLNINKPVNWTSTDVVRKVKRLIGIKKVGHGGTLDPFASGVLPIYIGAATRFAEMSLLSRKDYFLTVELGKATDTYDSQGKETLAAEWKQIPKEDVEALVGESVGEQEQIPPMYSAVKHNGKRLYDLARKGIEVERKPRKVKIYKADFLEWNPPEFTVDLSCSSGFYARTFAHEIGARLGSAAYLKNLVRTGVAPFYIKEAHTIDELETLAKEGTWRSVVLDIDFVLSEFPKLTLDPLKAEMVRNGRPVPVFGELGLKDDLQRKARAYDSSGRFLALMNYEPKTLAWHPSKVIPLSSGIPL